MYKILKAEQLTANIFLMDVEAPRVARHCEPGQFVIVKMDEKGERIPLTICDYDREAGTITIVFQPVGASTTKMKELKAGDYFRDFTGPLGNASELVEEDIEELKKKESGSLGDVMELQIKEHGDTMITLAELAKVMAHSVDELKEYLEELEESDMTDEEIRAKDAIVNGDSSVEYSA